MGVGGDGQGVREGVPFFDEDLVTYSATGGIKIYTLFFRKIFYVAVFFEILLSTQTYL